MDDNYLKNLPQKEKEKLARLIDFAEGVEKYFKAKKELKIFGDSLKKEIKELRTKLPKQAKPKSLVVEALESETPAISQGEVKSLQESAQQSLTQANQVDDLGRMSLPRSIEVSATPVNKKVNILDYIRTPDRVLAKIGLKEESDFLRKQYDSYIQELPKHIDTITEWSKRVPKEANQRIFKWLDGQDITLQGEELKVGNEIKSYLKEWAKRLGLPEDNRIVSYITHIFDDQLLKKEFDEDLAKRARTLALRNEGDYAIGTAGGSGVGKTSAVKDISAIGKLQDDAAMVLDSNFSSLDSAYKFIKEVQDAGKKFVGVFTYRDFIDALENGIVKRMLTNKKEMGRVVPNKVTATNHIGSWEVVKKLVDDGFEFRFVDNSLGIGKAKETTLTELAKKIKYPTEGRLKELLDKKIQELEKNGTPWGKLTPEQVKAYIE